MITPLEEHNILNDRQHAFRKSHSCETQLVSINTTKTKENKMISILDFEKAFDTVPHEVLKFKLHQLWDS
jgi:hypothetical protein